MINNSMLWPNTDQNLMFKKAVAVFFRFNIYYTKPRGQFNVSPI